MVELSFLEAHRGLRQQFKDRVPISLALALVCVVLGSTALVYWAEETGCKLVCLKTPTEDVPFRNMAIVANLLIFFIATVPAGAPAEFVLCFVSALACVVGIISPKDLYEGCSSNSVVTLAFLFPIMKAMGDTGIPERVILYLIGSSGLRQTILRMFMAVGLLSGIFNNTPIVVMMIPVINNFCQRLGLDKRVLLMPLSFAAQAGGSLTAMGSSINFVAQEVFAEAGYNMAFTTLTLGGAFILLSGACYCSFLGPVLLAADTGGHGEERGEETRRMSRTVNEVQQTLQKSNAFNVLLRVQDVDSIVGATVQNSGIQRIKGVQVILQVLRQFEADSVELANLDTQARQRARTMTQELLQNVEDHGGCEDSPCKVVARGWDKLVDFVLERGDLLQIVATAEGVANLRQVRGLELGNESELRYLGPHRRSRILCEVAVLKDMVGNSIDLRAWMEKLHCGVVGVRTTSQPCPCRLSYQGYRIRTGDILLVETFGNMIGSDSWLDTFGIVRKVPQSSPPREGQRADLYRALVTAAGLVVVVSLSSFIENGNNWMPVMCTIFLTLLVATKTLAIDECYNEVNGRVLVTIIGALSLGKAMQKSRLANCIAMCLVDWTKDFGTVGVFVGLYIATVGLGQFLNSAAQVAIIGKIGIPIAEQLGIPLSQMALLVVYAASATYTSPYGYQTNTLVMEDGKYSWADFLRFGGGLQVFHLVLVVAMVPFCAHLSPPYDRAESPDSPVYFN